MAYTVEHGAVDAAQGNERGHEDEEHELEG